MKSNIYNGTAALTAFIALIVVHWIVSQMYGRICAPPGFMGMIHTAFGMGSPVCSFLIMIQQRTAELYIAMWMCIAIAVSNLGTVAYGVVFNGKQQQQAFQCGVASVCGKASGQ